MFTIGTVAIVLALAFCSISFAERPIRILLLDPLSGPNQLYGDRLLLGLKFAVEEINAQGGLLGRQVEAIAEDSQVKPEVAVRKAQKYLMEREVDFAMVNLGAHVAKAVKNLTTEHNIVFINLTGSEEATGKDFSYNSVRVWYNYPMMPKAFVKYIAQNKPFKKFYLLNQDYAPGHEIGVSFRKEVMKQIPGAEIVGEDYHPLWLKDFSPFLTKIKATGAECILTGNWGTDISILVKQCKELGVPAKVANMALADPLALAELGEAAVGCIVSDTWLSSVNTPESVDFLARWQKRYKGTTYPNPDDISARPYIAARFVFDGIKKARSTEVNTLIPVLEGMRQKSLNGEIYLRACDHQLQSPYPVAEVVSKTYPFFGPAKIIPASEIEIEENIVAVDNPRCKK